MSPEPLIILGLICSALAAPFLVTAHGGKGRRTRRGTLPRNRNRHMRIRLRLRLRPGKGHATLPELWLRWGRFASFRRSGRARGSLTVWQRARQASEHSVLIGRAQLRHALRLPLEEHALFLAPPRTGKTGLLAAVILHYPGPVLSTTTKHDVFELTSGVRSRIGPVHVFNPQGIGRVPSTFRWSPIDGCQDPAVAIRRADGFANALKLEKGDNAFFQNAARGYLRGMFHAAALVRNGDMRLVSRWALTGTKGGAEDAENILRQNGAGRWADELSQLRGAAERTNATNEMVMTQALGFMSDPALAQSVLPAPDTGFDFASFLRERGSLYLIADSDNDESPLAPLFASLASEAHYVAAQIGQASPGGRLDPPLLMGLDEIVSTCPVPLPKWAADSGGKGIQLISVAHGEAQLASRWGDDGKQVILDTAGVKVLLPGVTDVRTLEMASKLCGQAAFREHGQEHHSRHDIMTPDMIRQLPPGRALIIRGGFSPVVAKLPRAWKDRAYRSARRRGQAIAAIAAAPAVALPDPQWPELGAPAARLRAVEHPLGDVTPWDPDAPELAEVLPADDVIRPWRTAR
jgi:type IV secretory pathway TraG/TraD family ATPase VirD4